MSSEGKDTEVRLEMASKGPLGTESAQNILGAIQSAVSYGHEGVRC